MSISFMPKKRKKSEKSFLPLGIAMKVGIAALLLQFSPSDSAQNLLPENRKGDWAQAGFFRQHTNLIAVSRLASVTEYGADNTGGGGANNQRAIMDAIADQDTNGLTVVYFPAGSYRITSPLSITSRHNIILRGAGSRETKLIFDFSMANNQSCIRVTASSMIGIENLYLERIDSSDFGDNISFEANDCWVSGVESFKAASTHISIGSSEHVEIRGCYIHHAWNYGVGGHGYGVCFGFGARYCLVEDNIFKHLRHSVILSNGPSANVIGYNYSTDPYTTETYLGISDWPSDMCLHGHPDQQLPGPNRNLFEGNICAFMQADDAWNDNGPYNTYFRNRATYYGLKITQLSDSQNVIANEVDDRDGALADIFWNSFTVSSAGNFVVGNIDFDQSPVQYPSASACSGDLSLYLNPDRLPAFLTGIGYFPPIGEVDEGHRGGGTIPAKKRWDAGGLLTVAMPMLVQTADMAPSRSKEASSFSFCQLLSQRQSPVVFTYFLPFSDHIRLAIYSLRGAHIATVVDQRQDKGAHKATWDGASGDGCRTTPAGLYIVRLQSSANSTARTLLLPTPR